MIRTIIIEDEDLSAKRLIRLLKRKEEEIKILKRLENIVDTITFLEENDNEIDLIFLDIHLSDGHSFEIFQQITINIPIIFTTAYDQYALEAFRQTSVDYLMKPIKAIDLERSLEKFNRIFYKKNREPTINYSTLLRTLQTQTDELKKRFIVQVGAKIRSIDINDIHLFYAENRACFLFTNQGKRYDINYTLEKLMNQLDSAKFFRVNRKVIINIQAIKEIYKYSKNRYKLEIVHSLGFDIYIPSERISDFKKWINW